jgi:hypothetical protein
MDQITTENDGFGRIDLSDFVTNEIATITVHFNCFYIKALIPGQMTKTTCG